jgi:hypothetical protein
MTHANTRERPSRYRRAFALRQPARIAARLVRVPTGGPSEPRGPAFQPGAAPFRVTRGARSSTDERHSTSRCWLTSHRRLPRLSASVRGYRPKWADHSTVPQQFILPKTSNIGTMRLGRCGVRVPSMDARRSYTLAYKQDDFDEALRDTCRPGSYEILYVAPANDNAKTRVRLSVRCRNLFRRLAAVHGFTS